MPKRKVVAVPRTAGQQTFEFVSYGRKGPSGARRLSPGQMEQVARTVAKTPEVMVKVSGGARDAGGAQAHFDYIDRHGKLDIETDEGREISGKDIRISVGSPGRGLEYSGGNARLRAEIPALRLTPLREAITKLYRWYEEHRAIIREQALLTDK